PMIIPFEPVEPGDSGDNRASALMATLLVVFGTIIMAVSMWGFLPTTTSPHDVISTPVHRGIPMVRITQPYSGKPRVASN
ncbi:MAG: hypothetical protein JSS86_26090, partial [Cyanobacteria bacterium SZAS LIN-2]|nr:hypothetical protein [Cyanobacteria bacterium SZAS LIN-2]